MREQNYLLSVVMCVYNTKSEYLVEAVKSILNQTYKDFELIIVDDCSSSDLFCDNTFSDPRILVIRNETNRGPSFSRNQGIIKARGRFIAFMDSDDISLPERFEIQLRFLLEHNDYVACSSWYKEFQDRNREICVSLDDFDYYRCSLLFKNDPPLNCSAAMVRSKDVKEILFDEKIKFGEDWKLWVQLSEKGKIYNIQKILSLYRIHGDGLTTKHKNGIQINERNNAVSARKYISNKLGLHLTPEEDEVLFLSKESDQFPPKLLKVALDKLVLSNKNTHYFNELSLFKKCKEIWKLKIQKTNNLKDLMKVLFLNKYGNPLLIKTKQLIKKIRRSYL